MKKENCILEKVIGDYCLRIFHDDCPDSPREWDNIGTMVCFHNRYKLGDNTDYRKEDYNSWGELKQGIIENEGECVILPLYLYDHSGITISTSPFSCPWDSGQIGFIFVSKHKIKEEGIDEDRVTDILKGEVETYDQYLTGDVYLYEIYRLRTCDLGCIHEELVDSCGGFFDKDICVEEGINLINSEEEVIS